MALYRDSFPKATITPKLHLLEDHITNFLRTYRVGFGFLGEQGAESIHARFNEIRKKHSMPNRVQQLKSILTVHLTQICPKNIVRKPVVKKRKREESDSP